MTEFKNFFLIIIVCSLILGSMIWVNVYSSDRAIASKRKMTLTEQEIQKVKEFFTAHKYYSNTQEYKKVAWQLKLFSREACQKKLNEDDELCKNLDSVKNQFQLYRLYVKHLLNNIQFDESVTKSFYFAHPEKFQKNKNGTSEIIPYNNSTIKNIRSLLVSVKEREVISEELARLMKKHGIN